MQCDKKPCAGLPDVRGIDEGNGSDDMVVASIPVMTAEDVSVRVNSERSEEEMSVDGDTIMNVGSTDADVGSNDTWMELEDVSARVNSDLSEEVMTMDAGATTTVGSIDADDGSDDTGET